MPLPPLRQWVEDIGSILSLAGASFLTLRRYLRWRKRRKLAAETNDAVEQAVIVLLEGVILGRGLGSTEAEVTVHRQEVKLRAQGALERLRRCIGARGVRP